MMAARRGTEPGDGDVLDVGEQAARRQEKRNGRRALRVLGILLLVVLLIVGGVVGYYWTRVNTALNGLTRNESMLPAPTASSVPHASPAPNATASPVTFVIMGSDSRDTSNAGDGRSDVLMVAYLSGDRQHAYLVSFPRDMWVDIPGHGQAKINAAYAWGGPALTVQTLEGLTGTKMDHAVLMDFQGFIELTNVLGGVTVYNHYDSSSSGYHFPQGEVTLQGEKALAYVRERYDLPHGDFDRAQRQRDVVQAIIDKILSAGVVGNPATFGQMLDQLSGTMTVDSGLTNAQITSLATSIRFTSGAAVRTLQAPVSGTGTSADGQSIDIVNYDKLKLLAQAMQTDQMEQYYQTGQR